MRRVFICGVLAENSGKTTFTQALLAEARRRGLKAYPFKPLSGHSYWWQYDSFKRCLEGGCLVCEDIYRLAEACGGVDLPLEVLNPADMLLRPPPSIPRLLASPPVQSYEWLAIGRFTACSEGAAYHVLFYNEGNVDGEVERLLDAMRPRAEAAIPVRSFKEFLDLHRSHYHVSVDSCFREVERRSPDLVVIESFNDSVYPWRGVEEAELVVAVAPGAAFIYEAKAFLDAVRRAPDPYTATFSDVASSVEPSSMRPLPPMSGGELRDPHRVAERYRPVVDEVLEALA